MDRLSIEEMTQKSVVVESGSTVYICDSDTTVSILATNGLKMEQCEVEVL